MFKSRPRKIAIFSIMFNSLNASSRSTLGHYCIRTASYKCHSSDGSAPIKDPIGAIVAELVAAGLDVAEAQWLRDQTDGSGPRCTPPPPTPDRR